MILKQEIYTCSATKRVVSLSFTGRHLLQNLREAIVTALAENNYDADNQAVSRARFKLAIYMSGLESNKMHTDLSKVPTIDLLDEVRRRLGAIE